MRITVISRSWPSNERSGVSLAVSEHVLMLLSDGHLVTIIGSHMSVVNESLNVYDKKYVKASGSGAIYSPAFVDLECLSNSILNSNPDLIVIESWQTSITDAAIDVAYEFKIPTLMISHGVSLHPYNKSAINILRSLAWFFYKKFQLPKRIARLSVITALDMSCESPRFYDRYLAHRFGIPVLPLVNSPINFSNTIKERSRRKKQILVVGYFSPVKNQLESLEIMSKLPLNLVFLFVGKRTGTYFKDCFLRAKALGIESRVSFLEDHECTLSEEIGNSLAVLCTSLTEVLPITLLEAMASGTPFVAPPVGAVPSLNAGIIVSGHDEKISAIIDLVNDELLWKKLSINGFFQYRNFFTREIVKKQLGVAIELAFNSKPAKRIF